MLCSAYQTRSKWMKFLAQATCYHSKNTRLTIIDATSQRRSPTLVLYFLCKSTKFIKTSSPLEPFGHSRQGAGKLGNQDQTPDLFSGRWTLFKIIKPKRNATNSEKMRSIRNLSLHYVIKIYRFTYTSSKR